MIVTVTGIGVELDEETKLTTAGLVMARPRSTRKETLAGNEPAVGFTMNPAPPPLDTVAV